MIDLFPQLFGTLKAATVFATFNDSKGRFKMFDGDESPTVETPFITIEIASTNQSQRTAWHAPFVTFHVAGKQTETESLWELANAIKDSFRDQTAFVDGTTYQVLGDAIFSDGFNPVTEHRVISVALRFGLAQ